MNKIYAITIKVLVLITLINLTIITSYSIVDRFSNKEVAKNEILSENRINELNVEFNKIVDDLLKDK